MGLVGSSASEYDPVVTLREPRARATEPGRDPHLRRDVPAAPLACPASRECEERPAAGREKLLYSGKKCVSYVCILHHPWASPTCCKRLHARSYPLCNVRPQYYYTQLAKYDFPKMVLTATFFPPLQSLMTSLISQLVVVL